VSGHRRYSIICLLGLLLLKKEEFQQSAAQAVAATEERLEALEQQYTRQVRQMPLAQDRGLDDQAG